MTKHVPADLLDKHMTCIGLKVEGGRADGAPQLSSIEDATREHRPRRPGGDREAISEEKTERVVGGMVLGASSIAPGHVVDIKVACPGKVLCVRQEGPATCKACGAKDPANSGEGKEKSLGAWSELRYEDCALCAASWFGSGRPTRVLFREIVEIFEVVPYSEVYGLHPRCFNFDAQGRKIPSANTVREHPSRKDFL